MGDMKKPESPCRPDCPGRSGECHMVCGAYRAYEEEKRRCDAEKQKIYEKMSVPLYTHAREMRMRDNQKDKKEGRL